MDFILRSKLKGKVCAWKCSHIFDFCVVMGSTITFTLYFFSNSLTKLLFEEVSEEILFVLWSLSSYLRLVMFIKNQRVAQKSAENVIDISNVITIDGDGEADPKNNFIYDRTSTVIQSA
eukprot:CAMPEP_0170545668 /NCGR_PEP_ID=MMETSP0211-20121228/4035_1 /TAXON_ID=311385 /ORGANISM="Pseudokeronopsis sp., Strain OXSARD2" /LENGTH=118 /DNA_ID=CAMNT_0010849689 /DNA_START=308 /DNA_END=664 /DNA_ORIENTATION=+